MRDPPSASVPLKIPHSPPNLAGPPLGCVSNARVQPKRAGLTIGSFLIFPYSTERMEKGSLSPTVFSFQSFPTDEVVSQEPRWCPAEAQPQASQMHRWLQVPITVRRTHVGLSPSADINGQVCLFLGTDFWKCQGVGAMGEPCKCANACVVRQNRGQLLPTTLLNRAQGQNRAWSVQKGTLPE